MSALSALFAAHQLELIDLNDGCQVDPCYCPNGPTYFDFQGPWMATADRYPTPGSRGGRYKPNNVRLAHAQCNSIVGGHNGRNRETRRQRRERERQEEGINYGGAP